MNQPKNAIRTSFVDLRPSPNGQPVPEFVDIDRPLPTIPLPQWAAPDEEGDPTRDLTVLYAWAKPEIRQAVRSWLARGGTLERLGITVHADLIESERSKSVTAQEEHEPHAADVVPVLLMLTTSSDVDETYVTVHAAELLAVGDA